MSERALDVPREDHSDDLEDRYLAEARLEKRRPPLSGAQLRPAAEQRKD